MLVVIHHKTPGQNWAQNLKAFKLSTHTAQIFVISDFQWTVRKTDLQKYMKTKCPSAKGLDEIFYPAP